MINSIDNQAPLVRKDLLEKYFGYYDSVCEQDSVKVCKEVEVSRHARHVLSAEDDPKNRFAVFDLYHIVSESLKHGGKDCRGVLGFLIKATEMLETVCVNLFLFPWKKEIKQLKTFTGPFVYCIQPVLPNSVVRNILESIGYYLETDTEYRLSEKVTLENAKRTGFELFLARVECEYLLEAMGQKPHAECLDILHKRSVPLGQRGAVGEVVDTEAENGPQAVDGMADGHSLVNTDASGPPECLEEHVRLNLEAEGTPEDTASLKRERKASSFMSEDKSILEMQKNYPDLAIRQKPIFMMPQRPAQGLRAKERQGSRREAPSHIHPLSCDMSGPQSLSVHPVSTLSNSITPTPRKLQIPEEVAESQPFESSVGQTCDPPVRELEPGVYQNRESPPEECLVSDLTERMSQMQVRELGAEETLKYPIEETAQAPPGRSSNNCIPSAPAGPARPKPPPILCSPSLEAVCSISGCSSCAGSDALLEKDNHAIKEPPQSLYLPPTSFGRCSPPLEGRADPQATKSQTPQCGDAPSPLPRRSPTHTPSEDEMDQTFVMV